MKGFSESVLISFIHICSEDPWLHILRSLCWRHIMLTFTPFTAESPTYLPTVAAYELAAIIIAGRTAAAKSQEASSHREIAPLTGRPWMGFKILLRELWARMFHFLLRV